MYNLEKLYTKLIKFKIKNNINFNIQLYNIKNIKIINTSFIPNNIYNYIKKYCKYMFKTNYYYNNYKISIKYYSNNNNINIIKKIIKNIIQRCIFMFQITNIYKNINIKIYDTPYKKNLPCYKCNKILTENNINSGLSYDNNIIIFRNEELLKVLIHELIHILDIDCKDENYIHKKNILNYFNINELLINESYVETWAIIINIYIVLYNKYKTNFSFDKFKKYFIKELTFNLKQCNKLFHFYNITNIKNSNINDKINIFSYILLKTYNLLYINIFLKKYMDKKNYIIKQTYDFQKYNNYLYNLIKKNKLKKTFLNNYKYNTLSMRMSIIK